MLVTIYKVPTFDSVDDFLQKVATVRGRLKKGGIVDVDAAARIVLHDWNEGMYEYCQVSFETIWTSNIWAHFTLIDESTVLLQSDVPWHIPGKIPYYTLPPTRNEGEHSEATIVSELGKEFNIDEVYGSESSIIGSLKSVNDFNPVEVPSNHPVNFDENMLEVSYFPFMLLQILFVFHSCVCCNSCSLDHFWTSNVINLRWNTPSCDLKEMVICACVTATGVITAAWTNKSFVCLNFFLRTMITVYLLSVFLAKFQKSSFGSLFQLSYKVINALSPRILHLWFVTSIVNFIFSKEKKNLTNVAYLRFRTICSSHWLKMIIL